MRFIGQERVREILRGRILQKMKILTILKISKILSLRLVQQERVREIPRKKILTTLEYIAGGAYIYLSNIWTFSN